MTQYSYNLHYETRYFTCDIKPLDVMRNVEDTQDERCYQITLENKQTHMRAVLCNIGATLTQLFVPDAKGNLGDVVLGLPDEKMYRDENGCYMGSICGRFANRIKDGEFELDGKIYSLAVNNGPNALHGGKIGWNRKFWHVDFTTEPQREDRVSIRFSLVSPDGEEGYPGNVTAMVSYSFTLDNTLGIYYYAVSDAPTVLNMTNHTYFNLAGEGSGSIENHTLQLNADQYLELDEFNCPTGRILPVENTPFDFRTEKPLGKDLHDPFKQIQTGRGFDTPYVLPTLTDDVSFHLTLREKTSGRVLRMWTASPCVQVYTGNWLGGIAGKNNHRYDDYAGVALEAQGYPAAPNFPEFPPECIAPDHPFVSAVMYVFSTEEV